MILTVGIDIGTSNCCVYAMDKSGKPELVPSQTGNALTPSIVAVGEHEITVGDIAQQQQSSNPLHTFYEFKRVIGRVYAQKELWHDAKHWPFHLGRPSRPETDAPVYHAYHQGDLRAYSAMDLTTILTRQLFSDIRAAYPDAIIKETIVTVPAHFDHVQRNATLEAVKAAAPSSTGQLSLCNEPTAAAVAYVHAHPDLLKAGDTLLVFDLGAGTLDITLLSFGGDETYNIIKSEGLADLGGVNFTNAILQRFITHVKEHGKQDIRQDKSLLALCRDLCEKAKKTLTICANTSIVLPNAPSTPPFCISKADFEGFIEHDMRRCKDILKSTVQGQTVHHVVLVGGSARVPAVSAAIQELLPASIIHKDINMDQCVAMGACYLTNSTTQVEERLSHAIGLKTAKKDMHILLHRNQTLPCEAVQVLYPESARQRSVEICLYQGEKALADENVLLGRLRLNEVPPNQPELRLYVRMDATGMIAVEIKDLEGRVARSTMKYNAI